VNAARIAAAGLAAAAACFAPGDSAVTWALRIAGAGVLITVVPGSLAVLAWQPRRDFTLLELLGVGFAVSLVVVQLLTIAAVMYSWSVDVSLALLGAWTAGHAVAAFRRRGDETRIVVPGGEVALACAVLLLGAALYVAGSPFDTTEPRVHISLVRRLVHLAAPTPYTLYVAPEVVYTYPFPGTHYLLALMSRAGSIDPFFLYYKTRAIWGIAAVTVLYGCVRALFGNPRLALASGFVAVALVANGAFGAVQNFSWAQLAPLSHASDVAMGVLLPALLLVSFTALQASDRRERRFFLAVVLGLALMLVMVHPREIVQFLVYLTAFAAVAVWMPEWRGVARRAAALVIATLAVLVVYRFWQQSVVPGVDALVESERSGLAEIFRDASAADLVGFPLPLLRNYLVAFEPVFHGWNPVVLLASPVALFVLRRHALALFLAAAIVCYLLIIRLPILAIPYAYLTYFEILYTPIRNVIFFIHVLAGVCLYLVAARVSRYRTAAAVGLAVGIGSVVAVLIGQLGPYLAEEPERADWVFVPVLAAYAGLAWQAWARRRAPIDEAWIDMPPPRWRLAMVALCIPLIGATELPASTLRHVSWTASPATPAALLASLPCLGEQHFCAPPRALIRFAQENVPVSSVFAVDVSDEYQPSLFMPQQMVAWPGTAEGLLPRVLFPRYFERYDRARAAYDDQPFFNTHEPRTERLAFVRDLGVTHVMVNPRMHALMREVLAGDPEVFTPLYDDGQWALYEVAPRFRGLRL
jgi:hypothetical protein